MSVKRNSEKHPLIPAIWAMGVAVFGLLALLLFNHGPWNKPQLHNGTNTTAASARAVGATVEPTAPKSDLEPKAPGPKPVAPAIPDDRKS